MTSSQGRLRATRRDRRKAKQSEYHRGGTTNPKKVGHHTYDARTGFERMQDSKKAERGPHLKSTVSVGPKSTKPALAVALEKALEDSGAD